MSIPLPTSQRRKTTRPGKGNGWRTLVANIKHAQKPKLWPNPSLSLFLPRRPFLIGFWGNLGLSVHLASPPNVWIRPRSCKWTGLGKGKAVPNPALSPARPQGWTFRKPHPVPRSLWKLWQPYLPRGEGGEGLRSAKDVRGRR